LDADQACKSDFESFKLTRQAVEPAKASEFRAKTFYGEEKSFFGAGKVFAAILKLKLEPKRFFLSL
jgi:hypothetical protein